MCSGPIHIISEFYCCPSVSPVTRPDRTAQQEDVGWRRVISEQIFFVNAMECVFVVRMLMFLLYF